MRHVWLVLLTLLATVSAHGQAKFFQWTPPDHLEPPFGQRVRKVVVFIGMDCKVQGKEQPQSYRGTGFLLGFSDPRLKGQVFPYLVTNRHVAECWNEENKQQEITQLSLLVNLKNGTSQSVAERDLKWRYSPDPSADIAVTPLNISDSVDYLVIPPEMYFEKSEFSKYNMAEGSKIMFAGYFYQLEGEHRVQPVIREGILSMIPDKPLITTTGKRGPLYLGDVHIFGGNSGSPVFINTLGSITLEKGPQLLDDYRLLGVVSGYYYEDSSYNLQIATTVNVKQRANSGISMIVPCDVVKDLIENDAVLKSQREAVIAASLPK